MSASTKTVFLSYATQDTDAARRICEALSAAGIEVWFDKSELRGGDAWDSSIRKRIKECAVFVPLISANTDARKEGYFRLEWKLAVERSHLIANDQPFLIPVVIDDTTEANARVPEDFRQRQWSRLRHDQPPDSFVDLVRRLLVSEERAPAAPGGAPAQATPRPGVSICVLPFENMSGDAEQEYFSDGISEDIITDLSKVSALWVAARNTSFTFKGKHVDVPQIARQLQVSHILEGSVRKAGNRVRITAQLIDGASGGHIWAERYDRTLEDIFAMQDEISEAIVAALKVKLLPAEKSAIEHRGTNNPEAYKLFLMARKLSVVGNCGSGRLNDAVVRLLQRTVEIDPTYARAWALLASAQINLRLLVGREGDGGRAAAERAVALDPNLAEARAAIGHILTLDGRIDAAKSEIDAAVELDPESYEVNGAAAAWNYISHRFAEAARHFRKATECMENDYYMVGMLVASLKAMGDVEGCRRAARLALERAEKVLAAEPENGSAMGFLVGALTTLGEVERAKEWIERALLLDPDNANMRYNFACALVVDLQEFDAAVELLAPWLVESPSDALRWMSSDPDMALIRDYPPFQALIATARSRVSNGA